MASGAENSEVPSLFSATALYTGTAWGSKTDGYTVTAEYTGEVSRMIVGKVLYSIVYEEVLPEEEPFPWRSIMLVTFCVGLATSGAFGVFWLMVTHPRKKPRPIGAEQKEAYEKMEVAL